MTDLNLKTFNKLYPMMIRKYSDLIVDQNASEKDKINSIILKLNALGKLSNDVVRDWNTVYQWAMNDGLTTDVNNKIEDMYAKGKFDTILNTVVTKMGDLTTLTTPQKDTIVNSINSLQSEVTTNTTQLAENTQRIKNAWIDVVKDFGAKGDYNTSTNTGTDDTTAFQNAINYAKDNNCSILVPKLNYKITNLRLYCNVTMQSFGAQIYMYPQSGVPAITIGGNESYGTQHFAEGITFTYKGSNPNDIGLLFGGSDYSYAAKGYSFKKGMLYGFPIGITFANNSWCINFDTFDIGNSWNQTGAINKGIYIPASGVNFGERISFDNCTFFGTDTVLDIDLTTNEFSMYFNNCSFDYCRRFVKHKGISRIFFDNCHFETTYDDDYLFSLEYNAMYWASLYISNSFLLFPSARTYHIFNVINLQKQINTNNLIIGNPWNLKAPLLNGVSESSTIQTPITGNGDWYDIPIIANDRNNLLNSDFEGDLTNWTTWNMSIYADSTRGKVAQFIEPTGGQQSLIRQKVTINKPYRYATVAFYYRNTGYVDTTDNIHVNLQYYDSTNTLMGSEDRLAINSQQTAWTYVRQTLKLNKFYNTVEISLLAPVKTGTCQFFVDSLVVNFHD